ncbi:MAG: AtpZ/AtpI family protein [Gammaproteobacteria bacterium]|jgi:ATP synthase protein I
MRRPETDSPIDDDERLECAVGAKADRRRRAREARKHSIWFGLGTFGLIGWAVALPTLAGIALGLWLDEHWPREHFSWTISLLFAGIVLGCANAWRWLSGGRESVRRRR